MYKTKYALLYHSWTYTNVYIGIVRSHFKRNPFIKALVAQSAEHRGTNLMLAGSSFIVDKIFLFCRFRRAPDRSTGPLLM